VSFIDKELQRLVQYGKGLGLTVLFKPYKKGSLTGGEYDGIGKEITIYSTSRTSKTDMLLILLHEFGHHLDFIYKGKRDPKKLIEALNKEDARKPNDPPLARGHRKYIYDCEMAGTAYMPVIAREIDLKIPMWKVEAEMELDRWIYRIYLQTGKEPKLKEIKTKRRELRNKLKERA
jgi:hypothetical protein